MELTNDFHVHVPVDEAWATLTDVERIAPCMPGAQLEEIEGDEYRGTVKVKVGPITAQYKGKATFIEKDDANHKAVLRAEGRDTKGQGNAAATITATLVAAGDGTDVKVVTDLTVTGRVAQFGRGVMADVSAKLLNQFVQCLEHNVLARPEAVAAAVGTASATMAAGAHAAGSEVLSATPAAEPAHAAPSGDGPAASNGAAADAGEKPAGEKPAEEKPAVRKIDYKPAEPVDLIETAGAPVIKRAAPIIALVFLLV